MALLTVITVVKDDVPGLARTLASIDEQQSADAEFLIVDGSSDRDTVPAAINAHPTTAATYSWAVPLGVYPAMNEGVRLARGSYVYFLNAGDTFAATDVLVRVTDQLASSQPTWAFGGVRFLQADGTVMPEPPWSYAEEFRHWFARGRFPAHQGVVVATDELRRQGGFDTTFRVAADYASMLQCATKATPLQFDFVLAEFTVGGLSTQQWKVAHAEFHRARRDILAPAGFAAIREQVYTWRADLSTRAYRAWWAPGRPAHGLMSRLRPHEGNH